jgi:hypothetical protein
MTATGWTAAEGTAEDLVQRFAGEPLMALVRGEVPALVLRQSFDPTHCAGLLERFRERGLLYDPHTTGDLTPRRIDIGTSFGKHRADRQAFFEHSASTHELFATLFDGYADPVSIMYQALSALAPDKDVKTARESDGSLYGPAIFRIYHAELGHGPHYDSVAKRSKAYEYAVSRFEHQFAGVLCLQNSASEGESGEAFINNCPWTPQLQPVLASNSFAEYAARNQVERVQVKLDPGDLYFFFSENIHEVPKIVGDTPRAVLAIFFAMSADDDEIFVWA